MNLDFTRRAEGRMETNVIETNRLRLLRGGLNASKFIFGRSPRLFVSRGAVHDRRKPYMNPDFKRRAEGRV